MTFTEQSATDSQGLTTTSSSSYGVPTRSLTAPVPSSVASEPQPPSSSDAPTATGAPDVSPSPAVPLDTEVPDVGNPGVTVVLLCLAVLAAVLVLR